MGLTTGLAGTICAGTTLVLPLTQLWPPSPADIIRSLRSTKITTCIIVPLLLEQLVDALESDVSRAVSEQFLPLVELKLLISEFCTMLSTHCTLNTRDGIQLEELTARKTLRSTLFHLAST